MSARVSKRPRVIPAQQPLMTQEEISKALSRKRGTFKTLACRYEPADGVNTRSRRTNYREMRAKEARCSLWYLLHQRAIKKIKQEDFEKPTEVTSDTEQVHAFSDIYNRCRQYGFCTDPWERGKVDEKFETLSNWTIKGVKASDGVRQEWSFEKGFAKIYRSESKWENVNFDEEDLAPEQTASGVKSEAWLDEYTKRQLSKPTRVSACPSSVADTAGSTTSTCKSSRASTIYTPDLVASQPVEERSSFQLKLRKISKWPSSESVSTKGSTNSNASTKVKDIDSTDDDNSIIAKLDKAPQMNARQSENEKPVPAYTSDSTVEEAVEKVATQLSGLKIKKLSSSSVNGLGRNDSGLDVQ